MVSFLLGLGACATTEPASNVWPENQRVKAHVELGMSYLQRDQLDVAREAFQKALSINQSSSPAYHGLGLVEAKSLNFELARNYLKRAVQLNPNNRKANSDYAIILCETQAAVEGIAVLEQLLLTQPDFGTQLALGRCYEKNQQLEKAEQAYQAVLATHPNTRQALISMAQFKYRANNYLSARGFLQRYFATNTVSADALLLAAKVENNLSSLEERDRYTKQLLARYPKSEQANQAKALFSQ